MWKELPWQEFETRMINVACLNEKIFVYVLAGRRCVMRSNVGPDDSSK